MKGYLGSKKIIVSLVVGCGNYIPNWSILRCSERDSKLSLILPPRPDSLQKYQNWHCRKSDFLDPKKGGRTDQQSQWSLLHPMIAWVNANLTIIVVYLMKNLSQLESL